MAQNIETKFTATLGSGTEQTFNSMQKGFQKIALELQKTAKELLNLQKTEAAEAVGHVSMAVNKFAQSLTGLTKQSKETSKELQSLEQVERMFSQTSKLAQEAWNHFKKDIEAGRTTLGAAKQRALEYDKALNNLVMDIKLVGGSEKDLAKNISFADIAMRQQAGDIKLIGGRFKEMNADAYKYFVTNGTVVKSLKELHNSTTIYSKTLREASQYSFGEGQITAIKELGQQVGYADSKFKVFVPVLKSLETNLQKIGVAQKALTGENARWITSVDRAAVVNQTLTNVQTGVLKHIQMTTNGIKILSLEGMKPFGDLTLKTAQSLGMLDPSFTKFMNNMNLVRTLTGASVQEINKMANSILKQTTSFEQANQKSKEYLKLTTDKIKAEEQTERSIKKLSIQYLDLLSSTTKSSSEARKWLDVLRQEPARVDEVKAALSKLNTEYKTTVTATNKGREAQALLVTQYKGMLTATGELSSKARDWIALLDKEPSKLSLVKTELAKLNSEFTRNETEIKRNREAYNALVLKYQDIIGLTNSYGQKSRELLATLQQEPNRLNEIKNSLQRLNSEYNKRNGEISRNKEAYRVLNITYRDLLASEDKFGKAARQVVESLKQEGTSVREVSALLAQLNSDHQKAAKGGDAFSNVINNIAKSFRTYASYMISSSVLRGFTEGIKKATNVIMEHDQSLYDLKAILGATSTEIKLMDDLMRNLATSSRYSIGDISDGMKEFGQAGFDATESMQGMPAVMNLATGTMEGLKTSTELVSTAVTVFGLDMQNAAMVSDIFANAVTKSRSTVAKLNTSFNYIGPVAEQAGLSIRDTAAATMLMYNAGLRASTVGTGFANMLTALMKPTEGFKKAIAEAGYNVDDFNPRMNSFETILSRLPNVVKNSEDAVKMFDVRAGRAIMAFTTLGIDQFRKLKGSLDEQGVAARMAATQMEGMANTWKNVKDNFEVLIIKMGDSGASAVIRGVINLLGGLVDVLNKVADTTAGKFVISFGSMVATLGGVTVAVKVLSILIGAKLVTALKAATVATRAFLANPIILALVAAGAAISAYVGYLNDKREALQENIKAENEHAGKMDQVKEKLDEYNKAVAEHGKFSEQAMEAGKNLKYAISEVGDSTHKNAEFIKKYGDVIDKSGVYTKDLNEFSKDLSHTLENEVVNAMIKSAKSSAEMAKTTNIFVDAWKRWSNFVNRIEEHTKLVDDASEAYNKLKVAANMRDSQSVQWLEQMNQELPIFVTELMKGQNASDLTNEKIEELAHTFVSANGLALEYEGALKEALRNMAISAQESEKAYAQVAGTISAVLSDINTGFDEMTRNQKTTFEDKMAYLDASLLRIKMATQEELQNQIDKNYQEIVDFKGTKQELEKLHEDHKNKLVAISNEGKDSEVKILKDKQMEMANEYKTQLRHATDYYNQEKALIAHSFSLYKEAEDKKLDSQLASIDELVKSDTKKYEKMNKAYADYTREVLESSDVYYAKLEAIAQREYEARVQAVKLLPKDEKDVGEKILKINLEQVNKQKEYIEARRSLYVSKLNEMIAKEKELTSKIKAELEERKSFNQSVEEILRELSYKTMNEKQIYEAKMTRAQKLESEAREAQLTGEYETAKKKAKEAIDAYNDAAGSLDKSNISAYNNEIDNIGKKIKGASEIWNDASGSIKSNLEQQKKDTKEFIDTMETSIAAMGTKITETINLLKQISVTPVKIDDQATPDLEKLGLVIDDLTKKDLVINFKASDGVSGESGTIVETTKRVGDEIIRCFSDDNLGLKDGSKDMTFNFQGKLGEEEATSINEAVTSIKTKITEIDTSINEMVAKENVIKLTIAELETIKTEIENLKTTLEKIASEWKVALEITVSGQEALQNVWDIWEKLDKSRDTIIKTIKYRVDNSENPVDDYSKDPDEKVTLVAAARAQTGKKIPGYGGGDKVPALLERGEWIINKEAVKHYEDVFGNDYWKALNEQRLRYKTGGKVGSDEEVAKKVKEDTGIVGTFDMQAYREFMERIRKSQFKNAWQDYKDSGSDSSTLFSIINELANNLDTDLTMLSSYAQAGVLGHGLGKGSMAKTKYGADGYYGAEDSEVPDINELSVVISEGLRAYNRKVLTKSGTYDTIDTLIKFKRFLESKTKAGVLTLSTGGSVSDAISDMQRRISTVSSPSISDLLSTNTSNAFSDLRRDDSASLSQLPPEKIVFQFPTGTSGEFTGNKDSISGLIDLIKRHKARG